MAMMQNHFHSSPPPLIRHYPPINRSPNALPPDLNDVQPYGMTGSGHIGQMNTLRPQMNQHPKNPYLNGAIPLGLIPPAWPSHMPQIDQVGQQRFLDSFYRYQLSRHSQQLREQLPPQPLQPQQHQIYQQQQKRYEQNHQVFRNPSLINPTTSFPAFPCISPIEEREDDGSFNPRIHAHPDTYSSLPTNAQPANNNCISRETRSMEQIQLHETSGQETSSETFGQITMDGLEYSLRRTEESTPLNSRLVTVSVSTGTSQTNFSSKTCIVCRQTFFSEDHLCSECTRKLKDYELLKKQRQRFPNADTTTTLLIGDLPPPIESQGMPLSNMPSPSSPVLLVTSATLSSTSSSQTVNCSPFSSLSCFPLSSSCTFASASTSSPSLHSISSSPSFSDVSVTSSFNVSFPPAFVISSSFSASSSSPCSSGTLNSSSTLSAPSCSLSISLSSSSSPLFSPAFVSFSSLSSPNLPCPNPAQSFPSTSSLPIHSSISSSLSSTTISDSKIREGSKVDRFLKDYDEGLEASFLAFVNDSSSKSCATPLTPSSQPCLKRKSPPAYNSIFENTESDFSSSEPFRHLKINKERFEALRRKVAQTLVVK